MQREKNLTKSNQSSISKRVKKPKLARHDFDWDFPVQYLKGVGDVIAAKLKKSDIRTVGDLLLTLPKRYEDRRQFMDFEHIRMCLHRNQAVYSRAKIVNYQTKTMGARGKSRLEADAVVSVGSIAYPVKFVWFHRSTGVTNSFPEGSEVVFFGKGQIFRESVQFVHPQFIKNSENTLSWWEHSRLVPEYGEHQGITSRQLRKIIAQAIARPEFKILKDNLPQQIKTKHNLPDFVESVKELHFPTNWIPDKERLYPHGKFFKRVVFEELFLLALALFYRRRLFAKDALENCENLVKISTLIHYQKYLEKIPFTLTDDQLKALDDVESDIKYSQKLTPMHRLVQGDVGSGKTMVAFLSALMVMDDDYQVALMAPTEILADQHFESFCKFFPERAHECYLLKGALTAKQKKEVRQRLKDGDIRFIVGTQALLTGDTVFEKLGLVIVDEQHRFGVEQRLTLKQQDDRIVPHFLVMTATPIPRSLALTLYGDLDLSLIKQKPAGRIPIKTYVLKNNMREKLAIRLTEFLKEKRQIYMVYPLVEESETLDLEDATSAYEFWKQQLPDFNVDLLHGRMKSADKDRIMRSFKNHDVDVLLSTTVIEVGVDVPNASVIIIENAERFGLSQLHQLRGRVGRGAQDSYCVLIGPDRPSPIARDRLDVMAHSDDGFVIAEKDLEIRGPGEFLGRRQSGLPGFRVAHLLRDVELLELAREEAKLIMDDDSELKNSDHKLLRDSLFRWWKNRLDLSLSG